MAKVAGDTRYGERIQTGELLVRTKPIEHAILMIASVCVIVKVPAFHVSPFWLVLPKESLVPLHSIA